MYKQAARGGSLYNLKVYYVKQLRQSFEPPSSLPGRRGGRKGVLFQGHPRPWPVAKLRTFGDPRPKSARPVQPQRKKNRHLSPHRNFLPPRAARLRVGPVPNINCPDKQASPYLALFLQGKPSAWFYLSAIPQGAASRCRAQGLLAPVRSSSSSTFRAAREQPSAYATACWRSMYSKLEGSPAFSRKYTLRRWGRFSQAYGRHRLTFEGTASWAVPAQAPEAVCQTLPPPVFVGVLEPKVSRPWSRQSPPALPHQTASGANAPLRSAPLVIGRLIAGPHTPTHTPAVNETANNQGPPRNPRFCLGADAGDITRPWDGKREYIYTREQRRSRCGC